MASRLSAMAIDAFTLDWTNHFLYAFPPFSILPQFLQKLEMDHAQAILIAPNWPTQPWYPKLTRFLIRKPLLLPRHKSNVHLPLQPRTAPPPGQPASSDDLPLIRKSLQSRGMSQATQDTILNSRRTATQKQYLVYLEKWQLFADRRAVDPFTHL